MGCPVGTGREKIHKSIRFVISDDLAFLCEFADAGLVATEGEPLVKAGVKLAFQLPDGPVLGGGFDLAEATFLGVLDS